VVVWYGRTDPGGSVVSWIALLTPGQRIVLVAALVGLLLLGFEAWLLLQMLAQQGRLLLRLDALESKLDLNDSFSPLDSNLAVPGLPVGQQAPEFNLVDLSGETVTLASLLARGKTVLLVFTDPGCGPCNTLLPEIGRWQREKAARITLAVISRGSAEANRLKAAEHQLTDVLLQVDREVANAYRANVTPAMVLVRPDGIIGSPAALGQQAIIQLIDQLATLPSAPLYPVFSPGKHAHSNSNSPDIAPVKVGLGIGDLAPQLRLPNLEGRMVSLESYRGAETLVLFWNPHCGFCNRMLGDLKAWEANDLKEAPRLLVVSTGAIEDNRAMGLSSTVVLDSDFTVGSTFGVSGTPSAVLIDSKGKITSEVTVGASAVLKLARAGAA
jgi:methylamine dehydrogenase accessory protein MauD